ncbi:STAS domain-containing protein [Yinghuangia sp. YIM S09857]|uniref:STAS domain-containing protein n=1 Tax=Yinghuangia sp. YIM S09857 TaxID=3436929 RepID=UPI003F53A639
MVEESGYPSHRVPSIPAPAAPARVRRFTTAIADTRTPPRERAQGGTGIGVVITSDRQLRVVRTARPRGIRLDGEVDLANVEIVRHSLRAVAREGAEVTVDVTRLGFIDVAGLRVVIESAHELAEHGGHLVLVGASRQLLRILRLCGWDTASGLRIGAPGPG